MAKMFPDVDNESVHSMSLPEHWLVLNKLSLNLAKRAIRVSLKKHKLVNILVSP